MVKRFIKPETIIYDINPGKSLLVAASNGAEMDYNEHGNLSTDTGDADGAEGEYSRNSNGGNIWDNAW